MYEIVEQNALLYRKDAPFIQAKLHGIEGKPKSYWTIFVIIKKDPLKIESLASCMTREEAKNLLQMISIVNGEIKIG